MAERHKIIPASYLICRKEDKIILMRRKNTGFKDGYYSLIAGHVDPNESFSQAIIREAKEEAGITVSIGDLSVIHIMNRKNPENGEERIDVYFIARRWEGTPTNMEPNKCDDLQWFDIANLPDLTIDYVRSVINSIQKDEFYSELGWEK